MPIKGKLIIIGGGLAGSEAAWQAAKRGAQVELYEMRPAEMTPAHKTHYLGELVCSNSFKSDSVSTASGLLKEEMRRTGSLIMAAADENRVPAGQALAVDRDLFARKVTEAVSSHPNIKLIRREVEEMPEGAVTIIASGPLTSESLAEKLMEITEEESLYFYDAISPIVEGDSINYEKTFFATRYDKGGDDYLNCPFTRDEYIRFWEELIKAKQMPLKGFEKELYFEGCLPVEEMARRGRDTLAFGPLKPVGLIHPVTGGKFYAVAQLRREKVGNELFNLVGFQTKMTYGEQKRVFRLIPGLENATFARFGSLHRNTFVNSPRLLRKTLQLKRFPRLLLAGQITGVEGYLESAATGLLAGINGARICGSGEPVVPPPTTALGTLTRYITESSPHNFQPANISYGMFDSPAVRIKSREERKKRIAQRALKDLEDFLAQI